jgi:hypothetical protein
VRAAGIRPHAGGLDEMVRTQPFSRPGMRRELSNNQIAKELGSRIAIEIGVFSHAGLPESIPRWCQM